MSEFRCTYYDPTTGPQTLGLYHGQDSGNVVIYHNSNVLIVDFKVHQPKSYSFMVNENLVKFDVVKNDGKFDYKFEAKRITEDAITTAERVISFFKRSFAYSMAV